jgi:hypothetical protein
MEKGYRSSKLGATVVMVVPVRADSKWWHDWAMKGEIRLFRQRLQFKGGKRQDVAPFATAIIVFRPYQYRIISCEVRPVFSGQENKHKEIVNESDVDCLLTLLLMLERKIEHNEDAIKKVLCLNNEQYREIVSKLQNRLSNNT